MVTSDKALSFESSDTLDKGEAEEDASSFSSWQIFFVFSFTDESLLTETSFFAKCFSEPGVTSSHTDVEDDLFTAG